MRIIELNAENWKNTLDFYDTINVALGAPKRAGYSIDALLDSMVWGGMNKINSPYKVQIRNAKYLSKETLDQIMLLQKSIIEACEEFRIRKGKNVDVCIEITP